MERKYFGTDGIRGKAGEPPLTPEFVQRLGRAAGRYFGAENGARILIGKDTRESGDMLEAALISGLLSQGVEVETLGVIPTPGVAYLTEHSNADAGVMISASHNPYYDNGIKFFGPGGRKLSDEAEMKIEEYLEEEPSGADIARQRQRFEADRPYLEKLMGVGPDLSGAKVVLDTANGATYRIAVEVFQRLGAEVFAIHNTPDGKNINRNCGSTHPESLQKIMAAGEYDVGFAFDGDGDRVIMVDSRGRLAHGDYVLYINAVVRGEPGVVGTIMSNMALERALERRGIGFERAQVGDRYVYQRLLEKGWRLGGEQSGHVIFMDSLPTGDGIQTALMTMSAIIESGRPLSDWIDEMPMYPQVLVNVRVSEKKRVMESPELASWLEEAEELIGEGRINVRPSGTEPLIRVMAEGASEELVRAAADMLADRIAKMA